MSESVEPIGVEHVVLLRVKEEASLKEIDDFENATRSLTKIPGVESVTVGRTFAESWMDDRRGGYTHALRVYLKSKEDLLVYQDHPFHVDVKKKFIIPIVDSKSSGAIPPILAIDWESHITLSDK